MKNYLALSWLTLVSLALAQVNWPAPIIGIPNHTARDQVRTVEGKLELGKPIEDLSWAASSQIACFPATQFEKYRGNHVFFGIQLPRQSTLVIKLIPKDPSQNLSLYAYSIGISDATLPPKIARVTSCESDEKWDRPRVNRTQDHTRSVELRAVNNPYNVIIGVSGPKEAVAGDFTLEVTLK